MARSPGNSRRPFAPTGTLALLAVATAVLAWSPECRAQQRKDPAEENARAIELSKQGALREAIDVWLAILDQEGDSYEFVSVIHRNVGRNYQKLGQLAQAEWHLHRCIEADPTEERCKEWGTELDSALAAGGFLRVELATVPESCSIFFNDGKVRRSYRSPLVWWLVPGEHILAVRSPDGSEVERQVRVSQSNRSFVLTVVGPARPRPPIEKPGGTEDSLSRVTALDWALAGTGVVLLAAGGVTWAIAADNLSDLDSKLQDAWGDVELTQTQYDQVLADWNADVDEQVTPYETASYVLWGVGAGTLAAAVVLAVVHMGDGDAPAGPGPVLVPVAPGGSGATVLMIF